MDIQDVRAFVAVVDEKGFRRAALALYLTQPAVTRRVRNLETALGVRLLDRGPEGAALTRAGSSALQAARALLAAEGDLRRAARPIGFRAVCRIGVLELAAGQLTGPLLQALKRRLPHVEFKTSIWRLQAWTGVVPTGLDVMLARGPWACDGVVATALYRDPRVLVVPARMGAICGAVAVEEAFSLPFFQIEMPWAPYRDYWMLADHGQPRRLIQADIRGPRQMAACFRWGDGVAVGPLSVVRQLAHLTGPVRVAHLPSLDPNEVALLSRAEDQRPAIIEVREHAARIARELAPLVLPTELGAEHFSPL